MPVSYSREGQPRFTGLLTPKSKPNRLPLFQDRQKMLTLDEIRKLAVGRVRSTVRFPAETWIKRQINNGCNGFAAAAALGRARAARGLDPIVLSGDYIYAHINGGTDRGSMLDDAMEFMQKYGIAADSTVKLGTWRKSNISKEANESAKRNIAHECYQVAEEIELLSGLAQGWFGVIAVNVDRNYETDSNGLVMSGNGAGNHAVAVDDVRVFDNRLQIGSPGSWGLDWGQDGYGWFEWKRHLATSCRNHDFYLIRSTLDDPEGTNPEDLR